jgi:hypothetical protein
MNRQPLQGLLQRLETRKYSAVTAEPVQSNPEHNTVSDMGKVDCRNEQLLISINAHRLRY